VDLSWLELRDFRCYGSLRFVPDPGINVLVGDNGAGKTSILEAIAYLGLLKSFRGTSDEALVRSGAATAVLRGGFVDSSETTVEVELPEGARRRVLLNGKRPQRNRDVLSHVPVVAFLPDDLDLVKRGPSLRRDYLDDLAAQLWPQAAADQSEFARTLRQRNSLLRSEGRAVAEPVLEAWDEQLAASGASVLAHRARVMTELDAHLGETYRLVGGTGSVSWSYRTNWDGVPGASAAELVEALRSALLQRRRRDTEQRTTSGGPHRDDPALLLDDRELRSQASQGEQRTAALSLRVAAHRVLTSHGPSVPVLLLDDVFSELDPGRVRGVMQILEGGQVLVTSAREDEVSIAGRRWKVGDGGVW
jgi:DNA replication and repair protein RecF